MNVNDESLAVFCTRISISLFLVKSGKTDKACSSLNCVALWKRSMNTLHKFTEKICRQDPSCWSMIMLPSIQYPNAPSCLTIIHYARLKCGEWTNWQWLRLHILRFHNYNVEKGQFSEEYVCSLHFHSKATSTLLIVHDVDGIDIGLWIILCISHNIVR